MTQSWSEPLVLWQALVGAPSAGKTPALDAIGRPLASVEKLLQRDSGAGASPVQLWPGLCKAESSSCARPISPR